MSHSAVIDADRLWSRLQTLAGFGAIPGGGVNRQALSAEDIEAQRQMIAWGEGAAMSAAHDAAGNLYLTLPGADPEAPCVLIGSHLDSQPTGGRFDGVVGVLAALEAATALYEAGERPARSIRVVAWMNEEGSRYAPGMMGSEAFAGGRSVEAIRATADADGILAGDALDRVRDALPLPELPLGFKVHSYVEPHIEQADVLEKKEKVIGAVTGIQGKKTWEVTLNGQEGHAGTQPMAERHDALQAFARCATALQTEIGLHDDQVMFTIGRLEVAPNAPSVVPARATFRIDLRHPDGAVLDMLGARLEAVITDQSQPCFAEIRRLVDAAPNVFDEAIRKMILDSADRHGFPAMSLLSAAGHDARYMAQVTRAAMIFIPCRDGISHAPTEWAEPAHVAAGACVLLDVAAELAGPLSR